MGIDVGYAGSHKGSTFLSIVGLAFCVGGLVLQCDQSNFNGWIESNFLLVVDIAFASSCCTSPFVSTC